MKLNKWILLPAAVGVIALGGVALADEMDVQPSTSLSKVNSADYITEEKVKAIAQEKAKGDIVEFSLDSDDNRAHYDIEMRDGNTKYEMDIDAITGDIYDFEQENENAGVQNTGDSSSVNADQTRITKDEAMKIAQEAASGKVTDVEIDDDEYEFEIRDGKVEYDIEINAFTGDIVKFEQEDEDDDNDDN